MPIKSSDKVVELLTSVYTSEIGAVGIYMDQHTKMADAGVGKFAEKLKQDALEEMKHAESLAERILFLGATVRYDKHDVPAPPMTEIVDILKLNIDIEIRAIERLNQGIRLCYEEMDNGSRLLLESILQDEERHLDDSETTLDNIEKYGDHYIVSHLI